MGSAGLRAASALPPRAAAAAGEGRRQGRRKRGGELHSVPRCSAEDGGGGLRSAPPGREAGGTPLRAAGCAVTSPRFRSLRSGKVAAAAGTELSAAQQLQLPGVAAAPAPLPCTPVRPAGGGGGGGRDANEGGGVRAPPVLGGARKRRLAAAQRRAPLAIPARSLCVARAGAGSVPSRFNICVWLKSLRIPTRFFSKHQHFLNKKPHFNGTGLNLHLYHKNYMRVDGVFMPFVTQVCDAPSTRSSQSAAGLPWHYRNIGGNPTTPTASAQGHVTTEQTSAQTIWNNTGHFCLPAASCSSHRTVFEALTPMNYKTIPKKIMFCRLSFAAVSPIQKSLHSRSCNNEPGRRMGQSCHVNAKQSVIFSSLAAFLSSFTLLFNNTP